MNENIKKIFHLMLFSDQEKLSELWLPDTVEGYFYFSDYSENKFVRVISKDGRWVVSCKNPAYITNVTLGNNFEMPLEDNQLLEIDYESKIFALYSECISRENRVYDNFNISNNTEITIGSNLISDICYYNTYVSKQHAVIRVANKECTITDCSSKYGVYVNGYKIGRANLRNGDVISIIGLKIIVGPGVISINNAPGRVNVKLQKFSSYFGGILKYYNVFNTNYEDTFFNRLPRKRLNFNGDAITVEGPPMSMDNKKIPLIFRMGSSIIMGGSAALAGNYTTLISSVLLPFMSSKYTDKQRKEYEELRQTKYTEYLEQKKIEIENACKNEKVLLNNKFPIGENLFDIVKKRSHLWERRPYDSDFLQLRLGTGTKSLSTTINFPERHFELESDALEEKMYQLVEQDHCINEAPITLSLLDTRVLGILGNKKCLIEYVRSLLLQIAVFHSYDEVKMIFLLSDNDLEQLNEIRYLPHVWDNDRTIRFIATKESEVSKVGEYINNQLANDKESNNASKILKQRPFFIVFAFEKKLLDSHEVFSKILQSDNMLGATIITVYNNLPKETQKIITIGTNKNICTTLAADGGEDVEFSVDCYDEKNTTDALHDISNIRLKTDEKAKELPKMVTFLEMFNVGRVEQLNSLKRWQDNNPISSLSTPVGVGTDGEIFTLDLHEKRQGPHGLVAGMTGSGKSEFIITYILSLAVNYRPDEVAFVLIDYKGGGLAGAFDNPATGVRLPHLVGTITNLDGASIQRSLLSIESELLRRQKKFNEVKAAVNEGTMDIYAYQKLYRAGKVAEPMPHLFIISDEFAELKQQQPEFMEKLISAARIGRSLGVHLILATQKPSGVVNDQIRSNTKFRVCLRVQDRSDSMDMLKRAEAAELTDTGRFYLQVGYNEYFALGQSAWCGAQYEPQDVVVTQVDNSIDFIDNVGQVIMAAKPEIEKSDSGLKQLVAVVNYLSDLAKDHNINPKQLWNSALPSIIDYGDLEREYSSSLDMLKLKAYIGQVDDPERQQQYPMCLDMQSFHHMLLCGLAGSGKSTFLKTMLYSLVMQYEPEDINYYILDLSDGMLSVLRNMPHCGAYLTKDDEADFDRMLALIQDIIDERKKLFSDAEVFGYEAYRKINKLPLVLVVIDGWTNINNFTKGQEYGLSIAKNIREASNYGVRFIFSVNHLNEVSARVKQEIDYMIVLQAKDRFDYNDILSVRNANVPPELPGRGVCLIDGRPLEYQVAIPYGKHSNQEQTALLKNTLRTRSQALKHFKAAKRLPVMNNLLAYNEFCDDFEIERIPIGFSMKDMKPVAVPLQQLYTLGLFFGNPIGIKPVVLNILDSFRRENADVIVVRRKSGTIFDRGTINGLHDVFSEKISVLDLNVDELNKLDNMIIDNIQQTKKAYRDEYCKRNGIPETDMGRTKKAAKYIRNNSSPLLVFFESFADLIATEITPELQAEFSALFSMLKGYNVYFVGCFYPEDENNSSNALFRSFNKEDLSFLFGGQFHKQWLTSIPSQYRAMEKINPNYNRFLMKYHNECHKMIMPCGELITAKSDPDEEDII